MSLITKLVQKILFYSFLMLLTPFSAQAQIRMIFGGVFDKESREPIVGASIRVLQQADSTFVTGAASNEQGWFQFTELDVGKYIVHASFIGYQDVFKNTQIEERMSRIMPLEFFMIADEILLDELKVLAQLPPIIMRGDTIEFTTCSHNLPAGARLDELLRRLPGVAIDREGHIFVNGERVHVLEVDSEEFLSSDPRVASQVLPSRMVDRVQVFRRMTEVAEMTGFGAGTEITVMNLVTHPGMREGIIGDASAGYGTQERYELRTTLNYMRNANRFGVFGGFNNVNVGTMPGGGGAVDGGAVRMGAGSAMGASMRHIHAAMGAPGRGNGITTSRGVGGGFNYNSIERLRISGGANYGHSDNYTTTETFTQNIFSTGNTLEQERSRSNNIGQNFTMNLRMDWSSADEMTRIMFTPTASFNNNIRSESGDFATMREVTDDSINRGYSRSFFENNRYHLGGDFHISRTIGRPGRVLSALLHGNVNDSRGEGDNQSNTYFFGVRPDDIINQRINEASSSQSWRGFFSFVEPIGERSFLQIAYTYSQNVSGSNREARSQDAANNFTVLDTLHSRQLENRFIEQNMEINFRSVRSSFFDYTVGLSVRPASSHSQTFRADSLIDFQRQRVVNFAPVAQLNLRRLRANKPTNHIVRLRYTGTTSQPTVQQLSPVVIINNPLNIHYGNPYLRPSFRHQLNANYTLLLQRRTEDGTFMSDPTAPRFLLSSNFDYITNDITTSSFIDEKTGIRETTFENISGNWGVNGTLTIHSSVMQKFHISSLTSIRHSHRNGFANRERNLSRHTNLMQHVSLDGRFSENLHVGVGVNAATNQVANSLDAQHNLRFFNYGGNASATITLPWDLSIRSEIVYFANSGLADGFEVNEWLWNASIQKANLFRSNRGALRLDLHDILQQQTNISRMVTANFIRDTTTNTLTSFVMLHFVYRFDVFRGDITRMDMFRRD